MVGGSTTVAVQGVSSGIVAGAALMLIVCASVALVHQPTVCDVTPPDHPHYSTALTVSRH